MENAIARAMALAITERMRLLLEAAMAKSLHSTPLQTSFLWFRFIKTNQTVMRAARLALVP